MDNPDPTVEKLPGRHGPEPLTEVPTTQKYPEGHARHALNAVDPLSSLYAPAGHAKHAALVPLPAVE
jgi:hypothetical protein